MKVIIFILAVTFSVNSFAFNLSTLYTVLKDQAEDQKIATVILNDSQDFYQTGVLSNELAGMVNKITEENPELSLQEAIDTLVEAAKAH